MYIPFITTDANIVVVEYLECITHYNTDRHSDDIAILYISLVVLFSNQPFTHATWWW